VACIISRPCAREQKCSVKFGKLYALPDLDVRVLGFDCKFDVPGELAFLNSDCDILHGINRLCLLGGAFIKRKVLDPVI